MAPSTGKLTALKRMFTLARRAEKVRHAPHIAMLKEANARTRFFEDAQFESVKNHLPSHMQGVARFAHVTAWRTPSEILPLAWCQVDFDAGEVRLDAGATKNDEARVLPFTTELRAVLEDQRALADQLQKEKRIITPFVFFYQEAGRFGGHELKPGRPIAEGGYYHAWVKARTAAGCPGRIPHDLRRTAVRNFDRLNASRSTAMKLTGHRTEAVYRRYAIVSAEKPRDAARRLDAAGVTVSCYSSPNSERSKAHAVQNA